MRDITKYEEYEINDAEIEKALRILRARNPDATRQEAVDFLIYLQSTVHEAAHEVDFDNLDALYEKFARKNKS